LDLSDPVGRDSLSDRSDASDAPPPATGGAGRAGAAVEGDQRFPWNRDCRVDGVPFSEGAPNGSREPEHEVAGRSVAGDHVGTADADAEDAVAGAGSRPSGESPRGLVAQRAIGARAVPGEHDEPPRRSWFMATRGMPIRSPDSGGAKPHPLQTVKVTVAKSGAADMADAPRGDSGSWPSAEDGGRGGVSGLVVGSELDARWDPVRRV